MSKNDLSVEDIEKCLNGEATWAEIGYPTPMQIAIEKAHVESCRMVVLWTSLMWDAKDEDAHYRAKEMVDLWTLAMYELKRRGRRHDDSLIARPDIGRVADALIRTALGE